MRKPSRCLLLLLACTLALRVSGMHVHVGDELDALQGVHIADLGADHAYHHLHDHHDGHSIDGHNHVSVDIGLIGNTPGKQPGLGRDLAMGPPLAAVVLPLRDPGRIGLPSWRPPPPHRSFPPSVAALARPASAQLNFHRRSS